MERVLTAQATVQVVAQCSEMAKLWTAVHNLRRSIVIFPSSFTTEIDDLLDWAQMAQSRAVMVLEPEEVLDAAIAQRLHGVVLRSVAEAQLMDCLYSVAAGERYMQQAAATAKVSPDHSALRAVQRLTERELLIVALICDGMKNKEIAHQLGSKEQAIKNNLRSIYGKTGVSDRLELALFTLHHQALAEVVERTLLTRIRKT